MTKIHYTDLPEDIGGGVVAQVNIGIGIPGGMISDVRGLTDAETRDAAAVFMAMVLDYHFEKRFGRHVDARNARNVFGRSLSETVAAIRKFDLLERPDYVEFMRQRFLPAARTIEILGHRSRFAALVEAETVLELARREREAAREEARRARLAVRRSIIPPQAIETTCADDGCGRPRAFFGEDGVGYCKRHGAARGLRPHGKI